MEQRLIVCVHACGLGGDNFSLPFRNLGFYSCVWGASKLLSFFSLLFHLFVRALWLCVSAHGSHIKPTQRPKQVCLIIIIIVAFSSLFKRGRRRRKKESRPHRSFSRDFSLGRFKSDRTLSAGLLARFDAVCQEVKKVRDMLLLV